MQILGEPVVAPGRCSGTPDPSGALSIGHNPTDRRNLNLLLSQAPQVTTASGTHVALAPRDAALLAWLALEGPTPRLRLAALLWPESAPVAARNTLRQRLFHLRKQLGADLVVGNAVLALADGVGHDLDEANTVLAGLPEEANPFGAWLGQQRSRRSARVRSALVQLSTGAEQRRDFVGALSHAQDLLALEPLSEDAHRRVIRLHYLGGDRATALLAFDRCERLLKNEVDAAPSAEPLALRATLNAAQTAVSVLGTATVPASVLRPPRLVGRDDELAALQQGWQAGHVVAVIGEAGQGKTRLLQTFIEGHPGIVRAAGRPGDAGVPLATLARLLRAVVQRHAGAGPASAGAAAAAAAAAGADRWPAGTRNEIARVLPEWAGPIAPPVGEGQRLVLQRALRRLLDIQPDLVGLVVDDLHFADEASLDVLAGLIDEDTDAPGATAGRALRWALAYRPAEAGSPVQALHAVLVEQARLLPVVLRPLDRVALAALVDSLALPGIDGKSLAPGLLRRTGGNPLFVLETLKQAWVENTLSHLADAAALPRPPSVARLIEGRLTQLSTAALALARCAALAGQAFSTRLATQVLGTPALGLADAWAELEAAQILRDQAFAHDLYFEATLASVPAAIARHLHGEIAAHLEADGQAAPATLAHHWLAAGLPARAAPALERAAQAATQALVPAEAARLWGQLAALRHDAGEAAAAFAAAQSSALALRSVTSGPALADCIDRLQALARQPEQLATAHEMRAAMFHARGEPGQAAASVALGLATLGAGAPPALRANLLNMHGVLLRHAGQPIAARAALEEALTLARGSADADLPALLNNLGLLLQEQDDHLAAIGLMQEAAERQTDALVRARVFNNMAISMEERGQVVQAREQRLAAARLTQGTGGVAELNVAISLGANARNLGRYRDALAHLEQARLLADGQPHLRAEDLQRQFAAVWLELGRINLATEAVGHALRLSAGKPSAAVVAIVQARLALVQGQDPLPLLAPAEIALRAANDQRALRRLWLIQAQALAPDEALALLLRLAATPALQANAAAALPVQVRLAQVLLALRRPREALRHAQRAADWLQVVLPLEMTPAEVWLTLARAAAADDAPGGAAVAQQAAQQAAQQGRAWVQQVAQTQLDEIYREGWCQRNMVNRELLALASRGAAS